MPDIKTSLHGKRLGLGHNDELILNDKVIADPTITEPTANGTGVSVVNSGNGIVQKSVISFSDHEIAMTDEAGVVAYGGSKVLDLPEGNILVLGAVSDLDIAKDSAGINDDFDGDFGVGTVTASNNATLATTEQNIIPTTATPQASSGETTADGASTDTVTLDGTSTAIDVFLNFLVDDGDQDITSTPANLVVNGTLTLTYINLGDF